MKLKSMPSLLTILVAMVVLFASCSQTANVPVPEDAAMVFHLDGESLTSKLTWDEIKQGELFKMAYEKADDSLAKTLLNDIGESGIDMKGDAYFAMVPRGKNAYMLFTCGIKDEEKFKTMMTKMHKHETVLKQDGLSIMKDDESVMTWKSDRMVFVAGTTLGATSMGMYQEKEPGGFSEDSLLKFAKEIYSMKKKNSIGDDKRFTSMMKEKGDAHFWMNASSMYGNSMPAMLSLTKASLLFEGNATGAAINFGDGQITVDAKSYYNKELAKIYEKYSQKDIDESMLKKIPSQNVAAAIAMNYPPEALKDFLTLLGVDGLVNMFLQEAGFTVDDFIKANKGDILFAVTDFEIQKKETALEGMEGKTMYTREMPSAKIIFATSVKDKASFDKLVGLLTTKLNEEGKFKEIASKIPYKLSTDMFVAGNDSATVHGYGSASNDHAFISKIKGHPMGGFIDIQKFVTGIKAGYTADSTATRMADESLKYWQDIVFYGGQSKNGSATSHLEINLVDKKTNSLKQLNNYVNFMFSTMNTRKHRDVRLEETRPDTLAAPRAF